MIKKIAKKILLKLFKNQRVKKMLDYEIKSNQEVARNDPDAFLGITQIQAGKKVLRVYPFGSLPQWRYNTLYTKEPETLEWIDTFPDGASFWDIGANVGIYTLYAAISNQKTKILSFEPQAANFFVLTRNIHLNKFDNQIQAYALAFNDKTLIGTFNMDSITPGGAIFQFGEHIDELKQGDHVAKVQHRQAMLGFTVDDFLKQFSPDFPTHVKIDVDGIEDKIVTGAKKTFSDERFQSLLIEMDENETEYVAHVNKLLVNCGLHLLHKKHSAMLATSKQFSSIYNYIYVR